MKRRNIIAGIVVIVFLSITLFHPFGMISFFKSGVTLFENKENIFFAASLALIMLCGLPLIHFRFKVFSFISSDNELSIQYVNALRNKKLILLVFGISLFPIYFSFKLSNSTELKRLAKNFTYALVSWLILATILLGVSYLLIS